MAKPNLLSDSPEWDRIIERIYALMDSKGLTDMAIADRAADKGYPVGRATISKMLRRLTANPGLGTLAAVAVGLDVPLPLLLGMSAEGYFHPLAFRTAAFLHEELTAADAEKNP